MENLIDALQTAVSDSKFQYSRRPIRANRLPKLFEARKWNRFDTYRPGLLEVKTNEVSLCQLVDSLKPVLDPFVQPKSGRMGNGLSFLTGGPSFMFCPTVKEFAQQLVRAAAHLGCAHMAELLSAWAAAHPLCYQANFLLDGIRIDQPIELESGVRLLKLPRSFDRFPVGFPFVAPSFPNWRKKELLGATVLSVDRYMFPVLFKPNEEEALTLEAFEDMYQNFIFSSMSIIMPRFSVESFCDVLSESKNCQVSSNFWWDDLGELQAFAAGTSRGCSWREVPPIQQVLFTQSDIRAAIQSLFHKSGKMPRSRHIDLATSRWIRAKTTASMLDAMIELRIAFEALYEIGGNTEKGFRLATYAAWHLGENVEERRECFQVISSLYGEASKILHASGSKKTREVPDLIAQALDYCYRGIMKRRNEDGQVKWTDLSMGADSSSYTYEELRT